MLNAADIANFGGSYNPAPPPGMGMFARMGPVAGSHLAGMSDYFFRRSGMHQMGTTWLKGELGLTFGNEVGFWRAAANPTLRKQVGAMGLAMRGLPMAFVLNDISRGYREGGVGGAVGEFVKGRAITYGFGAAWGGMRTAVGMPAVGQATGGIASLMRSAGGTLLGPPSPGAFAAQATTRAAQETLARQILRSTFGIGMTGSIALAALAIGAPVVAAYKAMDIGAKRMRASRALEFGTPAIDQFGTMATMRQRSIQAIQRSALNGRYAFNNEASLMHS